MVLESIMNPNAAVRDPIKIGLIAFIFVQLATIAAIVIDLKMELLLVVLVLLPSVPLILRLFNFEEAIVEDEVRILKKSFVARHLPVIIVLSSYFIGLVAGFTFWYLVLPEEVGKQLFSAQISELKTLNAMFAGISTNAIAGNPIFERILFNNLRVLSLIVIFSVVYGAGSAFILVWNASVIGVFLGEFAKKLSANGVNIFSGLGQGILGIFPHGSFELLAYLIGALAGGILSAAIIRRSYKQAYFKYIILDIIKLMGIAVVFVIVGALIEGKIL